VYAWSGRSAEGVSCLQQALTAYESAGIGAYHALSVAQLGEAYLLADQVDNAHACADRAVMLARGRGERGYEAWALRLLGEIAAHHAHPDEATAAAHYGAAMTLASELKMRPLVAHCHCGLGTLYAATGQREQARAELSTAVEMYRVMDMTFWLRRKQHSPRWTHDDHGARYPPSSCDRSPNSGSGRQCRAHNDIIASRVSRTLCARHTCSCQLLP
jgi:hypothetical protein